MNGPGVAFAEQVRFVTVAGEITATGFGAVGRRALHAEMAADRRDVTEASRHLGEVVGRWAALSPDAVGLRALADDVRGDLLGSARFTALARRFDDGSLRGVAFGLVTGLRSAIADLRGMLAPAADRAFDLALAGIDVHLDAALRVLSGVGSGVQQEPERAAPGTLPSPDDDGADLADLADLVRMVVGAERKDFSSPLSVSKSGSSNH